MTEDSASIGWREGIARNSAGLLMSCAVALLGGAFVAALLFHPWGPNAQGGGEVAGSEATIRAYPLRIPLPEPTVSVLRLSDLDPTASQDEDALDDSSILPQDEAQTEQEQNRRMANRGREFSDAFVEFEGGAAASRSAAPTKNSNGFIDVEYDISTLEPVAENYNRSDGSLTVQKPLFIDGKSSGAATIRIEEGAQILIATSSVAKALGSKTDQLPRRITGALAKGTGFIPFYELRGAGINVAYDPVKDRVSMSLPS